MTTLADRMQKLLDYYPSSDHERAEFQSILADVRELEEAGKEMFTVAVPSFRRWQRLREILTKTGAIK